MKSSGARDLAFTLIELLVVIAIIAILAAILFPVFSSAKEASKKTADASNMRQIATALLMYANDNDGGTPGSMHNSGGNVQRAWVFALSPYTTKVDELRVSPADPKGRERVRLKATSYVLNGYITDLTGMEEAIEIKEGMTRSLDGLPRPSETMLMWVIAFSVSPKTYDDHVHSYFWFESTNPETRWANIISEIQPGVFHRQSSDSTKGSANHVYADSHVKNLPASKLRGWAIEGFDFAKPPQD
ncbi:MAG: prepilin-type N-terminal cleavage/methylation domain-containing protein [Fimbriimonadaceae bacterium]|jgi:prepilin-type N-terminal cleavage/methylation domain-containing protein|nr:prepilin-type N-terminal cleavage/methylation domain-containing protein [Fimbriimonadaceae bacterium]